MEFYQFVTILLTIVGGFVGMAKYVVYALRQEMQNMILSHKLENGHISREEYQRIRDYILVHSEKPEK